MDNTNKYIPGSSYLVDYAIEHFGAEVIGVEKLRVKKPPFPCLTGALNTSSSFKIDKNLYPNIVAAGVDTLELNFGVAEYRQPDMFKWLNDAKSEAVSIGYKGRRGVAVDLFGQEVMEFLPVRPGVVILREGGNDHCQAQVEDDAPSGGMYGQGPAAPGRDAEFLTDALGEGYGDEPGDHAADAGVCSRVGREEQTLPR